MLNAFLTTSISYNVEENKGDLNDINKCRLLNAFFARMRGLRFNVRGELTSSVSVNTEWYQTGVAPGLRMRTAQRTWHRGAVLQYPSIRDRGFSICILARPVPPVHNNPLQLCNKSNHVYGKWLWEPFTEIQTCFFRGAKRWVFGFATIGFNEPVNLPTHACCALNTMSGFDVLLVCGVISEHLVFALISCQTSRLRVFD